MTKKHLPFQKTLEEFFQVNGKLFFVLLCLATLLLLYVKKSFIESNIAAFEVLEMEGKMGVFHFINTLQYLSIPLVYMWKFSIVALVLWIGSFMFGYKINYPTAWKIALVAESIFLIPELLKAAWFMFFEVEPSIWDVRAFYPFSIINFFDHAQLPDRWVYPLKALNLFEPIYWFLLVAGIHVNANKKLSTTYWIVGSSYVFFFFLWLAFYLIVYK